MGLFDGILIKDNHLACRAEYTGQKLRADEAVRVAREFLQSKPYPDLEATIVEVEVDSIEQLKLALSETPDIVLLDNMTILQLEEAVATRNEMAPQVELEASAVLTLKRSPASPKLESIASASALSLTLRSISTWDSIGNSPAKLQNTETPVIHSADQNRSWR